jgi:lysophospholipase L1-like esterase
MDQFILFGDSITQQSFSQDTPPHYTDPSGFFGPALADAYVRKLDVINRGFSGYNTRQALQVLPKVIPSPQQARVRFLVIFFGANDARLPNTYPDPQQHIALDEFQENLEAIVRHPSVQAHPDARLILITPGPVHERGAMRADEEKDPSRKPIVRRSAKTTAAYAQAVREVGDQLGVVVVDLWTAMMQRASPDYRGQGFDDDKVPGTAADDAGEDGMFGALLHDGLHFTREGYEVLHEELMAVIEKTWPDQMPEALPFVLPRWDDEEAWKDGKASML